LERASQVQGVMMAHRGEVLGSAGIPLTDERVLDTIASLERDLAITDPECAATVAYRSLGRLASELTTREGDIAGPEGVTVHAIAVELERQRFDSLPDGTLVECGGRAQVLYQYWLVERHQAAWTDATGAGR
jgi:hypothetical protein